MFAQIQKLTNVDKKVFVEGLIVLALGVEETIKLYNLSLLPNERLLIFGEIFKFKNMADYKQVHNEIDEMIQHGGDIYRALDTNGNGVVTTAELIKALKTKQSQAKGQQVELYQLLIDHVKDIDKNHDNNISFVEFMRCFDKLKAMYNKR